LNPNTPTPAGGTTALLAASAIRTADFGPDVLGCLPDTPWRVKESDLAERRDLRWGLGHVGGAGFEGARLVKDGFRHGYE